MQKTAKEIVQEFRSLFPSIVVEKWFPGSKDHSDPKSKYTVRIMSTDRKWYEFVYRSENDWTMHCSGHQTIRRD